MRWASAMLLLLMSWGAVALADQDEGAWLSTGYIQHYADVVRRGGTLINASDTVSLVLLSLDGGVPPEPTEERKRLEATVTVIGELDPGLVHIAAARSRKDILRCADSSSHDGGAPTGVVVVKLTVMPNGVVGAASFLATTFQDSRINGCLASVAKGWAFPRSPNGGSAVVTYPFRLPLLQ